MMLNSLYHPPQCCGSTMHKPLENHQKHEDHHVNKMLEQ